MNNRESYKTLYEQLQAQCNLIEANIAQAQAVAATDMADKVSYAPSTPSAGTSASGGIPIPPGLPPAPGLLPDWPMPPIGGPGWNEWLSEWLRLNGPTGPRPGESASEYQQRRKANQALQRQFGRWRDMYWRLSQQRPMSAVQESVNLIEKRFDISKFNKSKKNSKNEKNEKKDKKANKDYDGDGEVESAKDEYFGSKDKAIKKAIADKKKKKTLKEGTVISYGQISYGGFPRILNEAKYNIPAKADEMDMEDPSQIGLNEFEKLMKSGSHPVMGNQNANGERGVAPELRKQALQHIDSLKKHPSGKIEGYSEDHPVYKQGMEAYTFFKKHFPAFGVEDQIGEDYGIKNHKPS
jgi:hypothetical protein